MNQEDLSGWRVEIDSIDRRILKLLDQRSQCALKIAEVKRRTGRPIYDPDREREVINALCDHNHSALPAEAIRKVFSEIVSACRAVQEPTYVTFLGPEDTFSHMAAISHFGRSAALLPRNTIGDVFREVEGGKSQFGVVPAENSSHGAVGMTLDEWAASRLNICGEILLPISHVLMSRHSELPRITSIFSHPQALGQCRDWLARNLPQASLIETASTALAAQRAATEEDAAAVGAEILAQKYSLNVLAKGIQDQTVNLTRFWILGKTACPPTGKDKTSLWFVASHTPGSLYKALSPLADAGVNLTSIVSRPTRQKAWEYIFFIDFEGHQSETHILKAVEGLSEHVEQYRIIGSYPAADLDDAHPVDGGNDQEAGLRLVANK